MSDIGGMFKGNPVGDGTLGNSSLKAVGMSDDPVCHESAVGATGFADTLFIDLRVSLENFIGEVHQVLVIYGSVNTVDVSEVCAASVRTSRVAEEHEVSGICPNLHLIVINIREYSAGAAVDMEDSRVGNALFVISRFHYPAVDLVAVTCGEGERLRNADGIFLAEEIVEVSDLLAVKIELCKLSALKLTAYKMFVIDIEAVAGAADGKAVGNISVLIQFSEPCKVINGGYKIEITV